MTFKNSCTMGGVSKFNWLGLRLNLAWMLACYGFMFEVFYFITVAIAIPGNGMLELNDEKLKIFFFLILQGVRIVPNRCEPA